MICQTCGAALGRGTAAHHLTCRYCGAVHSDPAASGERPYEKALNCALDETGTLVASDSHAVPSFELDSQCYSSTAEVPPDVRAALDDASRALDDIFGGPPMKTSVIGAVDVPVSASPSPVSAQTAVATTRRATHSATEFSGDETATINMDETAPMPPMAADEILAAAQAHSHADAAASAHAERRSRQDDASADVAASPDVADVAATPEFGTLSSSPKSPTTTLPSAADRPAPSRVTLASDPVPFELPEWMKHFAVVTAIAVIALFTLTGIAILIR